MNEEVLMFLAGVGYRFSKNDIPENFEGNGFERTVTFDYDYCNVNVEMPLSDFTLQYKLNDDYYEFERSFNSVV